MSRISIDVSPNEHKILKSLAALKGKSMKDYLLEGKIPESDPLEELEALLDQRIKDYHTSGKRGRESATAILQDVIGQS